MFKFSGLDNKKKKIRTVQIKSKYVIINVEDYNDIFMNKIGPYMIMDTGYRGTSILCKLGLLLVNSRVLVSFFKLFMCSTRFTLTDLFGKTYRRNEGCTIIQYKIFGDDRIDSKFGFTRGETISPCLMCKNLPYNLDFECKLFEKNCTLDFIDF